MLRNKMNRTKNRRWARSRWRASQNLANSRIYMPHLPFARIGLLSLCPNSDGSHPDRSPKNKKRQDPYLRSVVGTNLAVIQPRYQSTIYSFPKHLQDWRLSKAHLNNCSLYWLRCPHNKTTAIIELVIQFKVGRRNSQYNSKFKHDVQHNHLWLRR